MRLKGSQLPPLALMNEPGFNSTLVRLKEGRIYFGGARPNVSFNSTLVRLKGAALDSHEPGEQP